ncbi:carboxylesterase family protein [Streptomyces sp. NPDC048504]|uniref:carboxylesterase family protein n=1 Tax=Streptomyces sp. NPDC048504 TaxID=3365559 RepID=UPI00370FE98E
MGRTTTLRSRVRTALATVSVLGLGLLSPIAVHVLKSPPAQGSSAHSSLVVSTATGKVRGQAQTGYDEWLGIPYAATPTAAHRWTAPRPASAWSGIRDPTRFGDRCAQASGWDPGYEKAITTEDCLDLNVYTPQGSRADTPVVVWIHGGGFSGGAGQDTNPRKFAQQTGAIVVTVTDPQRRAALAEVWRGWGEHAGRLRPRPGARRAPRRCRTHGARLLRRHAPLRAHPRGPGDPRRVHPRHGFPPGPSYPS